MDLNQKQVSMQKESFKCKQHCFSSSSKYGISSHLSMFSETLASFLCSFYSIFLQSPWDTSAFSPIPKRNGTFLSSGGISPICNALVLSSLKPSLPVSSWLAPGPIRVSWTPSQGAPPDRPSPDKVGELPPPVSRPLCLVGVVACTPVNSSFLAFLSRLSMKALLFTAVFTVPQTVPGNSSVQLTLAE